MVKVRTKDEIYLVKLSKFKMAFISLDSQRIDSIVLRERIVGEEIRSIPKKLTLKISNGNMFILDVKESSEFFKESKYMDVNVLWNDGYENKLSILEDIPKIDLFNFRKKFFF